MTQPSHEYVYFRLSHEKWKLFHYLMWSPGWDKDDVSFTLRVSVSSHPVLLKEAFPELSVQVDFLVVDRIRVGLNPLSVLQRNLVEHISNLVGVTGL